MAVDGRLDAHHCTAVLRAATTPTQVGRIAQLAAQANLSHNAPVVRALFGAWCRCHYYQFAMAVLEEAVEHEVLNPREVPALLNNPLARLAKSRDYSHAWELFRLVQATTPSFADGLHYNIMLQLTSEEADEEEFSPTAAAAGHDQNGGGGEGSVAATPRTPSPPTERQLLAEMRQAGLRQDTATFNTRLQRRLRIYNASAAAADLASSTHRSGSRSNTSSSSTTTVCAAVERLLHEMRYLGVAPNKVTYILLHQFYLENALAGPPLCSTSGLFVTRGAGQQSSLPPPR